MAAPSLSSVLDQLRAAHRAPFAELPQPALLRQAKISLLHADLLVPSGSNASRRADLASAREVLELAALLAVRMRDAAAFERYLAQLSAFWDLELTPPSSHHGALVGLHLLLLLSRNEVGRFHTVLETMAATGSALMDDKLVLYPIELERHLMEGSYSKVWAARCNPPLAEYAIFLEQLMTTIRNEIASCGEKAYTSLPVADAATLLFFDQMQDLLAFAAQRPGWQVNPTAHVVTFGNNAKLPIDEPLQRERIIESSLTFASALESIV